MGETSGLLVCYQFESTGDSELDARPSWHGTVAMEDDDAGSCCHDDLGSERDHEGDDSGEGEDSTRKDTEGGGGGRELECLDKVGWVELASEMERSRLFWEACLASNI